MFFDHSSSRHQVSSSSFQDQDFKSKNQVSSPRAKRGQEAQLLPGYRTHQKEASSPPISATNMPTTRSQSKAMSTPQVSPAQKKPGSPKSTPSQESPESTISQETPRNIPSQDSTPLRDNLLSPRRIHANTIIMGYPLKSEVGQKLQKWVLYQLIHDPTNFWLSWDPTDSEDIRLLQKYAESNGSIFYLPSSIVKNLISLGDYMNLLIKQDRPTDQKYNKLYYLMDEQWTKLTAHYMRSALVDEKFEKLSSHMTSTSPYHMPHFRSPTSLTEFRQPLQVQSHLEMPGILVQLGHTQRT